MTIYYQDDHVTLYHGDCREITEWAECADLLVTDPPYGRAWRQGRLSAARNADDSRPGIAGDTDTSARDDALTLWGNNRPAVVFGDLMLPPHPTARHVLIYAKPADAGIRGAVGGYRRDAEAIYLLGKGWGSGIGGRSSILRTNAAVIGNPYGVVASAGGHPHTKPGDIMATLIDNAPPGTIADPFTGSWSTLVAAKHAGRRAVGVEIEERYCEMAARRLAQDVLTFG